MCPACRCARYPGCAAPPASDAAARLPPGAPRLPVACGACALGDRGRHHRGYAGSQSRAGSGAKGGAGHSGAATAYRDRCADRHPLPTKSGARGPLPLGMGVNGPYTLQTSNTCAILPACARAMNPCLVGFGPVHLHNLSSVRRVAGSKPSRRKTFAVTLDASKYLGVSAPSSSGGHPASSLAWFARPRSPRL
jgi:hypothetical protein